MILKKSVFIEIRTLSGKNASRGKNSREIHENPIAMKFIRIH